MSLTWAEQVADLKERRARNAEDIDRTEKEEKAAWDREVQHRQMLRARLIATDPEAARLNALIDASEPGSDPVREADNLLEEKFEKIFRADTDLARLKRETKKAERAYKAALRADPLSDGNEAAR